jgi:hypothetical protein
MAQPRDKATQRGETRALELRRALQLEKWGRAAKDWKTNLCDVVSPQCVAIFVIGHSQAFLP